MRACLTDVDGDGMVEVIVYHEDEDGGEKAFEVKVTHVEISDVRALRIVSNMSGKPRMPWEQEETARDSAVTYDAFAKDLVRALG